VASISTVYTLRNQRDEVFDWLDRAYRQHDGGLIFIKHNSLLKNLHGHTRYAESSVGRHEDGLSAIYRPKPRAGLTAVVKNFSANPRLRNSKTI
jgi:hypothetical protein